MILKNLWRRATRSLLTILGIAIGVAAVVALGAMAQGMVKNYGSAIGLSNDLLVIQANALDAAVQQPGRTTWGAHPGDSRRRKRGSRRLRLDRHRGDAVLPGLRL